MAFITQCCRKFPDWRRWRMALGMLLLAGCSPAASDFGFRLEGINTRVTADALNIAVKQKLVLSPEARNALKHGVPLVIRTDLALRVAGSRRDIKQEHKGFEIRYLPLSNRYQLTTRPPFSVSTFPRLRHVLAELATVSFTLAARPMPAGEIELRVRSFLEKRHMPPPMRLPVWFSSQWQHDSGWRTWPLAAPLHRPDPGSAAGD